MSKAGHNPLEDAKVSSETPAKKAASKSEKKAKPSGLDPLTSDTATHPPAKKAPAKKAPPGKPAPKFRVIAECTFSRNGHITKLSAGAVISAQHYGGLAGIKKLTDGGLQLEEL